MKKLICVLAALMLVFTACGNNGESNTAEDGIIEDGDGIINEDHNSDTTDDKTAGQNVMDDAADGADDLVDGAADATKDAVDGMENAVDNVTGNENDNTGNNK